jgi:MSHA biogenesis protein MshI
LFGFFNKRRAKQGLVGLSVIDKTLAIAYVSRRGEHAELQHCESMVADTKADVARLLAECVQHKGLQNYPCNYVLAPDDYNLLLIEAPAVEKAELAAAAKWKIKDMIDQPLEQLAVSVFPVPKDAYRSQREMIYVVVAERKKIQHVVDLVSNAGLQLSSIDIPELAYKNAAGMFVEDQKGVAMMDLRHDGSILNLQKSDAVYFTRHINTHIGEDILTSIEWEGVRDRLALEIQRSLDFYESQMGQSQIGRILLAPRRNDSLALGQQLNEVLGVRVDVMDLQSKLAHAGELSLAVQHDCLLAIGGALRVEQAA